MNKHQKILFILNPISGTRKKSDIAKKIEEILPLKKIDFDIQFTQHQGHAIELSKQATNNGFTTVVAVGGDGSVNEVAQGLLHTNTAMGIIPAGSGNGLARFLKIPFNTVAALDVICKQKITSIDTLNVNDNILAVSIAGIGFDASIARQFADSKHRGFFPYLQIALERYFTYQPEDYELTIDGEKIIRNALFISFANSDQFGFNTSIAPNADITDGLMDVTIFKKVPVPLTPFVAPLLFLKQINSSSFTEIYKAKKIEIELDKGGRYVNIDGEAMYIDKKLTISIVPKSLKVITP